MRLLNVGGGSKKIAIPDYYAAFEHLLLDIDPKGAPDVLCDARDLGARPPAEFDAIYCSHNLEHFYAHDVPKVLTGFLHVLKPDGFAEIRVPDLAAVMRSFVEDSRDLEDELYRAPVGSVTLRDVIYGFGPEIARSGQDFYAHRTGFTQATLGRALQRAGFSPVVLRKGRPYEIVAIGFRAAPTAKQRTLLGLRI